MKKLLSVISAGLLCVLLQSESCMGPESSTKNLASKFESPIKGLFLDSTERFQSFKINPSIEQTLTFKDGNTLRIPLNAFVDAKGNVIKEEVELLYRSIYSHAEIISSNIHMMYDSAGTVAPFISGGMFEVRARRNEEEVFLAENKSLSIDFGSYGDNPYNLYKYVDGTNQWDYLTSEYPKKETPTIEEIKVKRASLPEKPIIPQDLVENLPVIDLSFSDVQKDDSKQNLGNFLWQEPLNSDTANSLLNANNNWVRKEKWVTVDIEAVSPESEAYVITLKSYKNEFKTTLIPVLKGKKKEEILSALKEKIERFDSESAQISNTLENTRSYTNTLTINSLGVFNCDIMSRYPNGEVQIATNESLENPKYYALSFVEGGRVSLVSDQSTVRYLKNSPNVIVVLDNNKLYGISRKNFRKVMKNIDNEPILANYVGEVNSMNDLEKHLMNLTIN